MRKHYFFNLSFFLIFIIGFSSCKVKKTQSNHWVHTRVSKNKSSNRKLSTKYAEVLGVNENSIKNQKLYAFIDDWEGTPYQYGGSSKSGIDCSSFSGTLIREIYGIQLPRVSSQQAKMVKRKYIGQLQEGDLVFFKFGSKKINHVGVYLQNGKFVHASTSKGVIVSNLNDPWYRKVYVKAGSIN